MWAQRCGILPRPVHPRGPPFPSLPRGSISGAPTSQLSPRAHRLTSLSPPRSTGQAPALPHQGNPPSEISRQAVRRQPAEDRLLRRQGASPPPPEFPRSISRNGTRKSRCSPHPVPDSTPPPDPPLSIPRFTSIRPTTGFSRVFPTSTASSTPRRSPRSPSVALAPATTQAGRVQHGLSRTSSAGRRSRARRSTRRSRRRRRRRRWRRARGERRAGPGAGTADADKTAAARRSPCSTIWCLTARYDRAAVRDSMIEGRDSKNPTRISWERDFGAMRTSAHAIGHGIDQAEHGKPQFARLPIVESTFYRPQNCPYRGTTRCSTRGRSDGAPSP